MKTMISVAGSFVLAMLIVGCEGGGDDGGTAVVPPDCEGITDIGELALCMRRYLHSVMAETGHCLSEWRVGWHRRVAWRWTGVHD